MWAAVILVLAFSLWHFAFGLERSHRNGYADDVPIFAQRAAGFLQDGVLYPDADRAELWGPGAPVFKYPPIYITWLLPLVKGGVERSIFDGLWWGLLAIYVVATVLGVVIFRGKRLLQTAVVFAVLALNFEPFYENLWHLQFETLFVLAFMLALYAFHRRRDFAAGALIGVCASLKIFPVFLLLYFVLRGRWKVVVGAVGTAILALVFSLIVVGVPAHLDFFGRLLPGMLDEPASLLSTNQGLARYVQDLTSLAPQWSKRIAQLLALCALVVSVVCVRRNHAHRENWDATSLEFAMFVSLLTLSMPNFWTHYQVLQLLPLMIVTHWLLKHRSSRSLVAPLVVAAYALTLFYSPCQPLETGFPCAQTPHFLGLVQIARPIHDALAYAKMLSNVLLWVATVVLLWDWSVDSGLAPHREQRAAPG